MSSEIMADDPLYTALYNAAKAAKQVRATLHAATSSACDLRTMRMAVGIERRLDGDSIFDLHFEDELRDLAKLLGELAERETRTSYVFDEHCMSGTYTHSVCTEHGRALLTAQTALQLMANAVGDVRCHLTAERLAFAFRA